MRAVSWSVGLVALLCAAAPSVAVADCPSDDDFGNCGPAYAVPSWTDAGGWTDPSKYGTIQLADVNGDGADELIGRNDAGLEIWRFDKTVGQWRPQVDAKGLPQILTDFASFPPWKEGDPKNPKQASFSSTIQAFDLDGQGGKEILARFWDGMRVYRYQPGSGTNIDGGIWVSYRGGPFSDADGYTDASLYNTIGVGQFRDDGPFLYARLKSGADRQSIDFYMWANNNKFVQVPTDDFGQTDVLTGFEDQACSDPSCYLTLQPANVAPDRPRVDPGAPSGDDPAAADELLGRTHAGAELWDITANGGWEWLNTGASGGVFDLPFGDTPASEGDCPFSAFGGGASGPGSGDCVGSTPSYYETLQAANIDGREGDELLARASDGLRVRWFYANPANPTFPIGGQPYETLGPPIAGSLSGDGAGIFPGQWGSIRTADIDGDGKDEVLANDGTALRAWTFSRQAWSQMPDSNPVKLAVDPWSHHPEYYATLKTGDVDGDGRDDVVARGPFGIRTFFYDRRKTGGWERYLQPTYPALQNDALVALTQTLQGRNAIPLSASSPRDVYTAENKPDDAALTSVKNGLAQLCKTVVVGWPTSYQDCAPPNTSIAAGDWTAVINQVAAEVDLVTEVNAHFADVDGLRAKLFMQESVELPAIGDKLGLAAAAGSTGSFNMQSMWSTILGIAGSVVGLAGPEVGAGLAVASYVVAAVPETSDTADDTFQTTYAGLQDQFAQMADEITKGLAVQNQQIRQDYGLLELVAQLRKRGTWALDEDGIESAANQGFVTWVYRSLTPAVYDRYVVTNCHDGWDHDIFNDPIGLCQQMPAQVGVIGSAQNFTYIGDQMDEDNVPCSTKDVQYTCWYAGHVASGDVLYRIWGDVTTAKNGQCNYVPGKSSTIWTFGCPAGVDITSSLGGNTWGFTTYTGSPWVDHTSKTASASASQGAQISLGAGQRTAGRGRARLYADVTVPRGTRLDGATLRVGRLLHDEPGGHGELSRRGGRAAPFRLRLRRVAAGRYTATRPGRHVRISLRRMGPQGRTRLSIAAPTFRAPRTCHALPASVALDCPPLHLESRLVLDDGASRLRIRLDHHVRCRRDKAGNVRGLEAVRFPAHPSRPGLAVRLDGPASVTPGTTARFVARVSNRRHRGSRAVSSVWDVKLRSGGFQTAQASAQRRPTAIRELRRGRSRSVVVRVPVPRDAAGRFCPTVAASAPGTRAATARACASVASALAPRFAG